MPIARASHIRVPARVPKFFSEQQFLISLASRRLYFQFALSRSLRSFTMAPKQATLGYVKSSQTTLGWVFLACCTAVCLVHTRSLLTSILASFSVNQMAQSLPHSRRNYRLVRSLLKRRMTSRNLPPVHKNRLHQTQSLRMV